MRFASGQQDGDKASFSICECMDLRVAPSARTANSLLFLPFPPAAERWASRGWSRSSACLRIVRSRRAPGTDFPRCRAAPPNKPVLDRGRRAVFGRAIAPAAAASQHMHDSANDAHRPLAPRLEHPSVGLARSVSTAHHSQVLQLDARYWASGRVSSSRSSAVKRARAICTSICCR